MVGGGRVVEGDAEGLQPDAPVLEGRLADQLGPEPFGSHLAAAAPRHRHLVVAEGDERALVTDEVGPVPGRALVRVEAEADVAADRAVRRSEVEVPRLVPERVPVVLVTALVAGRDGHRLMGR